MIKKQNLRQQDNNCLICYEESKLRIFCSDCNICEECYSDYLINRYKNSLTEINQVVKCANHKCMNNFELIDMIHKLQEDKKQIILKLLLDNYITNKNSIVRCPNKKCDYAAFLTDEDRCCEQFLCEFCGDKWKNKNKLNTYYSKENIKAEYCEMIVYLTSVPCTNCSIRISKTQGCDHIKCVRCETEFCYNCMKDYSTHLKENNECTTKRDIKALYCFAIVIFALFKFLLGFATTRLILHFIFYRILINFVLINVICCLYTYIVIQLLANILSPYRRTNAMTFSGTNLLSIISQVLLVMIGIIHLYMYYSNDDVHYYTIFFIKEIIALIILFLSYLALHFIYSKVTFRIR